ncbi:MAG: uroporphyrinogen-III synthase [Planctomycetes bacterium]|nr:uroporphyrinogen-III synthase [Planctomycetota bacterium]
MPISLPCLAFRSLSEQCGAAQEALNSSDWAVFSSPRGVQAFLELELRLNSVHRIACVGEATAEACRQSLRVASLVAREQCAASLAMDMLEISDWQGAALLGASDSRPELAALLCEAGKEARACPIYSTSPVQDPLAFVTIGADDVVFLASPSALQALLGLCELPTSTTLISIGPTTSEAIRAAGYKVTAEAQTRNVQGMLTALAESNRAAQ